MKKIALIVPLLLALFILAYFAFNVHFFANQDDSTFDNSTPVISDDESIVIPNNSPDIADTPVTPSDKEMDNSNIVNDNNEDSIMLFADDPIDVLTISGYGDNDSDSTDKTNP